MTEQKDMLYELEFQRAQLKSLAMDMAAIADERNRLHDEVARLKEACDIFRRYGLPPHDVSGLSEWNRACNLIREEG